MFYMTSSTVSIFECCIPMGTNCAPLLVDFFRIYSYEADFIQGLLHKTFRYIDDVFSLNNCKFGDFVGRIYPIELEIKDTTERARSSSYLDLHLEIDSEGRLRTRHYHKGYVFNFPVVNLPQQQMTTDMFHFS
jgi:hypothetical protein